MGVGRPSAASTQMATLNKSRLATPQYYVPSVLLPSSAEASPSVHKIHILGEDERSKFIAHALSGVYDSVEMLGWRRRSSSKYSNLQKSRTSSKSERADVEPLAIQSRESGKDINDHIESLIVTGRGHEAAAALESVKHRVDENTTVCLMNDGLGVLEDVRRKVFNGGFESQPNFVLGHMSHRLAFNRSTDSVKEIKSGQTRLTPMARMRNRNYEPEQASTQLETVSPLVDTLAQVKDFRSSSAPFDQWLRFKLPSVIFDAAVEPVCIALDVPYKGLLQNPSAQRMMHQLLDEILKLVMEFPEVRGSEALQQFVDKTSTRYIMYGGIVAKKNQPSKWAMNIARGLPTDVEHLNGYFVRRAGKLRVPIPFNEMMRDLVKAKHSRAVEERNSYVPIEETSVPSEEQFRYRTTPKVDGWY